MKWLALRLDRLVNGLENVLLGALMLYAAGMLCTQIVARSVFGHSFFWAEESVRYAIVWMVFIGSAVAFRLDAHITIDAVHHWVPASARRALQLFVNAGCLLLAFLLARYGLELVQMMQQFRQTSPALEVPMYVVYAVIPGSACLMAYRILQSIHRLLWPMAMVNQPGIRPVATG